MTTAEEIALGEALAGVLGKALDVFNAAKSGKVTHAEADTALSIARAQLHDAHEAARKAAEEIIDERFPPGEL